jgi:cell wall-associated NlpC family hydrolase
VPPGRSDRYAAVPSEGLVIPTWAGRYVGAPFEEHGRGPGGYDCWGLVVAVYREVFGIELPTYDHRYASTRDREDIAALIDGGLTPWRQIPVDVARPGDGVIFRVLTSPCHIGVVVDPPMFLHIARGSDACLERWDTVRWEKRFLGIWRHEEMDR